MKPEIPQSLVPFWKNLDPAKQGALLKVLEFSPFLARWTQREPKATATVLQGDWKTFPKTPQALLNLKHLKEILAWEEVQLHQALLEAKYKQLFRITLLDMGLHEDFSTIAWQLSELAQQIIQVSLTWWRHQLEKQYGIPKLNKEAKTSLDFAVLAMGKLGGMELNFSSDVDLIYFYESDKGGFYDEKNNQLNSKIHTPHGFFCKLAEKLSKFLNHRSGGGFLYRVDLELRPEGKSGTLANSLAAMEYYYENFGAAWEKQAFIKAKLAAGSQSLANKLLEILQPFIYPKSTDFRLLDGIQEMKQRLAASIQYSSAQGYHVKLGAGGIRELEFFVQSLQLLYGGKHPQLQTQSTLKALGHLKDLNLITSSSAQELRQAYIFLRTLENRLQQVEEQQTHRIPETREEREKIIGSMDYTKQSQKSASERFEKDLIKYQKIIETHFSELLAKSTAKK